LEPELVANLAFGETSFVLQYRLQLIRQGRDGIVYANLLQGEPDDIIRELVLGIKVIPNGRVPQEWILSDQTDETVDGSSPHRQ
jgi:hypothetical protein